MERPGGALSASFSFLLGDNVTSSETAGSTSTSFASTQSEESGSGMVVGIGGVGKAGLARLGKLPPAMEAGLLLDLRFVDFAATGSVSRLGGRSSAGGAKTAGDSGIASSSSSFIGSLTSALSTIDNTSMQSTSSRSPSS